MPQIWNDKQTMNKQDRMKKKLQNIINETKILQKRKQKEADLLTKQISQLQLLLHKSNEYDTKQIKNKIETIK